MALLPPKDLLFEAIEMKKIEVQKPRSYLGYSGMAHACHRYLKYSLHWCYSRNHEPRVERIFRRGDYEETVVQADFARIGITHFDDQLEVKGGYGYAKGHIDGKVKNVPGYGEEVMLLEVKTMNDKRFKEYLQKGLQEMHPVYYGQIMSYMGKLGLKNTLYVVTNKNDEHRNYKIIPFDEEEYKRLEDIANAIPLMHDLPDKIGGKTWHACKYCDAKQICHYKAPIQKTCRSCKYVTLEGEGKWGCSMEGYFISYEEQLRACGDHELDVMFL